MLPHLMVLGSGARPTQTGLHWSHWCLEHQSIQETMAVEGGAAHLRLLLLALRHSRPGFFQELAVTMQEGGRNERA